MNTLKKFAIPVVAIVFIVGTVTFFALPVTEQKIEAQNEIITVTLSIDEKSSPRTVSVPLGTTALAMLEKIHEIDETFILKTKRYEGLGTLVEQLGESTNGESGKYWHYYINDELPMVGADQHVLKNGDHVLWRFETSND